MGVFGLGGVTSICYAPQWTVDASPRTGAVDALLAHRGRLERAARIQSVWLGCPKGRPGAQPPDRVGIV